MPDRQKVARAVAQLDEAMAASAPRLAGENADLREQVDRLAAEHAELRALVKNFAERFDHPAVWGESDRSRFVGLVLSSRALLARLDGGK